MKRAFDQLSLRTQLALAMLVALVAIAFIVGSAFYFFVLAAQLHRVVIAVGCAFAFVAAALVWLFSKTTSDALLKLSSIADVIRRAENEPSLPLFQNNDEMLRVSSSLREMVNEFNRQKTELLALNATLNENVEARTREITTLVDFSKRLSANQETRALMRDMLVALKNTIDYQSASIWTRENGNVVLSSYEMSEPEAESQALNGTKLPSSYSRVYSVLEQKRKPLISNNSRKNFFSYLLSQFTDGMTGKLYQGARSWMATPLVAHDDMIGALRVDHVAPNYFTPERERLLEAIGNQAALAIEHARLFTLAEQAAVMAERNRIARDLHDAVSQTLFAASVTADSLDKSFQKDPHQAKEQLDELRQLNRGALAEMRMLLFELRPDALRHADLEELLGHLVNAARSRLNIEVDLKIDDDLALPSHVKTQFYRIAQEALNNIAKHSRATHASVSVARLDRQIELRVTDNGCGFDDAVEKSGHFGLTNMRERAQEIGAVFELKSAPDKGAEISVVWGGRIG
jgi:signal transduction histidine kinase